MKKCSYCGHAYPDDILVCAADQTPLDSGDSAAPTPSSEPLAATIAANAGEELPDGFCSLGKFGGFEAERLLKQFTVEGIRFLIDKIDGSVFSAGGLTRGAGYTKTALIEIFVPQNDEEKATKIVRADWKV